MFEFQGIFSCGGFLEKSFARAARRIRRLERRINQEVKLFESVYVHSRSWTPAVQAAPASLNPSSDSSCSYQQNLLVDFGDGFLLSHHAEASHG